MTPCVISFLVSIYKWEETASLLGKPCMWKNPAWFGSLGTGQHQTSADLILLEKVI